MSLSKVAVDYTPPSSSIVVIELLLEVEGQAMQIAMIHSHTISLVSIKLLFRPCQNQFFLWSASWQLKLNEYTIAQHIGEHELYFNSYA